MNYYDNGLIEFSHKSIDRAALPDALEETCRYWEGLTDHGKIPSWREFELMDIPPRAIHHTTVCDVINAGKDFRVRFWGSGLTEISHIVSTTAFIFSAWESRQVYSKAKKQRSR